jgi:hypothetical protein
MAHFIALTEIERDDKIWVNVDAVVALYPYGDRVMIWDGGEARIFVKESIDHILLAMLDIPEKVE